MHERFPSLSFLIQSSSLVHVEIVTYSASPEDNLTIVCLLLCQKMGFPLMRIMNPVVQPRVPKSPPQSASTEASMVEGGRGLPLLKWRPYSIVP